MKKHILFPLLQFPALCGLEHKLCVLNAQNWNLDPVGMQNLLFLTLYQTKNCEFHFAVDYCKNALPSYRDAWQDAGWELCTHMAGYFVWRIAASKPQINIPERLHLVARRKKISGAFRTCGILFFAAALMLAIGIVWMVWQQHTADWQKVLLEFVAVVLAAGYFFWSVRMIRRENLQLIR